MTHSTDVTTDVALGDPRPIGDPLPIGDDAGGPGRGGADLLLRDRDDGVRTAQPRPASRERWDRRVVGPTARGAGGVRTASLAALEGGRPDGDDR